MGNGKLPDIYYEQYVLGELDDEKRAQVEAAEDFHLRIEEIKESNHRILESFPPSEFTKRIRNAYEADRWESEGKADAEDGRAVRGQGGWSPAGWFGRPVASFGLSAAVLVVVAAAALVIGGVTPSASESLRTKGLEAELRIYRTDGSDVEVLRQESVVAEGDLLQLSYNAAGGQYGTIFSVDGRGAFTLHFPPSPEDQPAIESSGDVLLPYAYRLDDAPQFEKFYFITSDEPFDLDSVLEAVNEQIDRQEGNPDYDMTFDQNLSVSSLVLRKAE